MANVYCTACCQRECFVVLCPSCEGQDSLRKINHWFETILVSTVQIHLIFHDVSPALLRWEVKVKSIERCMEISTYCAVDGGEQEHAKRPHSSRVEEFFLKCHWPGFKYEGALGNSCHCQPISRTHRQRRQQWQSFDTTDGLAVVERILCVHQFIDHRSPNK